MAYLEAHFEQELYIEPLHGIRGSKHQVVRPQKAMYGLVLAGMLWSKRVGTELKDEGLQRSQEDPCIFERQWQGNMAIIIVVYVDDLLPLSATQEVEKYALGHLRSNVLINDSGEALYYLGCHTIC